MREAADLWRKLAEASDAATRDEAWGHPDFIPTADDIADPENYIAKRTGAEVAEPERDAMDDELEALLTQGRAEWDADRADDAPGASTAGATSETPDSGDTKAGDPDARPSGDASDPRHGAAENRSEGDEDKDDDGDDAPSGPSDSEK